MKSYENTHKNRCLDVCKKTLKDTCEDPCMNIVKDKCVDSCMDTYAGECSEASKKVSIADSLDIEERRQKAMDYFLMGYNCSQSVCLAFCDLTGLDQRTLSSLASSFGGGLGRLREVCGAVSGMSILAGLLYGYDGPETGQIKNEHYARIQTLAKAYEEKNGSIVCRELLGLTIKHDIPEAEKRTKEYYRKRPCKDLVGDAAGIFAAYLKENPPA